MDARFGLCFLLFPSTVCGAWRAERVVLIKPNVISIDDHDKKTQEDKMLMYFSKIVDTLT